jgi:ArsR family transcriptional regulator, lead/cadmium/zinc/bismuth-responsive transcriptional repressor
MEGTTCIRLFVDSDKLKNCKEKIRKNEASFRHLSDVISLAGNDVRLKILYLLEKEGELCPCDLNDILEMNGSAISQHLKKLKDGNHIQSRKVGQTIYYSLRAEHLKILGPFFKYIDHLTLDLQKQEAKQEL